MEIDLSKIPGYFKLEVSKDDLEAFGQKLLEQAIAFKKAAPQDAKEILNVNEASDLTGLARQTLYGMTSQRTIPFFKRGKRILFKRSELEQWLLENRQQTISEIKCNLKNPNKP
jgi:excisionase family DNA binding protein